MDKVKMFLKKYGMISIPVILIMLLLGSCSGGKKSVAMDYAEAMLSDFNAKKMVSLMSDEFLEENMESMNAETKKILIAELEERLKSTEKISEDSYGDNWKVKFTHVDTYKVDSKTAKTVLNVTYTGSGGLFGLTDLEDTEQLTIYLVKEGGKWRVDGWE